jgi:hypothetical protein
MLRETSTLKGDDLPYPPTFTHLLPYYPLRLISHIIPLYSLPFSLKKNDFVF